MNQQQVDNLNKWQAWKRSHPYTCGSGNRSDDKHLDNEGILEATLTGWKCPYCDYTQIYGRFEKDLAKKNPDEVLKSLPQFLQ